MRGPHYARLLASTALSLMLAVPLGALAQDSHEPAATFNERFPADQTSTEPSLEIPEVKKEQNVVGTKRAVRLKRPRSRVVVVPRSFLNPGTHVGPGERKSLDYAFPPTHAVIAGAQLTFSLTILGPISRPGALSAWHSKWRGSLSALATIPISPTR
jgi:hypothetical protein